MKKNIIVAALAAITLVAFFLIKGDATVENIIFAGAFGALLFLAQTFLYGKEQQK
ncbi:hypothetical protein [Timonella sp. A28]|uniref:hypothetical protein n=1 Tax=Timonella sp. A28 TaxID=3442640 RepID=UPI003EBC4169